MDVMEGANLSRAKYFFSSPRDQVRFDSRKDRIAYLPLAWNDLSLRRHLNRFFPRLFLAKQGYRSLLPSPRVGAI